MTMMANTPGMFFVFEGPNGSGKTTAMKEVASRMRALGAEVVTTREPGGSVTAEEMRRLLLDPRIAMDPQEQTLLFMAARRNHLRTVIFPAMERGAIVLCDRFVASTLVYQTLRPEGGPPMSMPEVVAAHAQWCWGTRPDLQFHLHIPVERAAQRRTGREMADDRYESDDMDYERACADRYAESAQVLGFREQSIDADRTPDAVADDIMRIMSPVAEDRLWSIMVHVADHGPSGRWFPMLDETGRPWWTHEPTEAHRRAADVRTGNPTGLIRFVRRSIAADAVDDGMTTDALQSARQLLAD